MKNNKFVLNRITRACILAIGTSSLSMVAMAEEENDINKAETDAEVMEVIEVTGIRGSKRQSLNDKRFADGIIDNITAEDIGELPDANIAEAMQRITGVQMMRDEDGTGTSVQIRGLSDNNITINGQDVAGTAESRNIDLADLPSELYSGITVRKTPTADRTEGSLGGSISLNMRKPMQGKSDFSASANITAKYAETVGEITPDFSLSVNKKIRDTQWGDFGFTIVGVHKDSKTAAGDFGQSSGTPFWQRIEPNFDTVDNVFKPREANAPFNSGPWAVNGGYDITGDGYGINDTFYAPRGTLASQKTSDRTTNQVDLSFQWRPQEDVNLYFQYSTKKTDRLSTKASLSSVWSASNTGPLVNGYYDGKLATDVVLYDDYTNKLRDVVTTTFSPVALGTDLGDVYLMTSGLVGGAQFKNVSRYQETEDITDRFTLGGDWIVSDALFIKASLGYSQTQVTQNRIQTSLSSKTDVKSDMVHFDLRGVDLMNLTFFQSPWSDYDTTHAPDIVIVDELRAFNPSSMAFENLRYDKITRGGKDSDNSGLSAKIDFDYDLDYEFFHAVKWGVKVDRRDYLTLTYQNKNTGGNSFNADGFATKFKVNDVYVNPVHDPSPGSASHLRSIEWLPCVSDISIELNNTSGQVPTQFLSSNCSQSFFNDTLNLLDIRAVTPESGGGVYSTPASDIDIKESSDAFYIRADFLSEVANMPLSGNFGVRYVSTTTESSGWQQKSGDWSYVTEEYSYTELLPSLNINLAITDEMYLRFAVYRTMSRPKLTDMAIAGTFTETNTAEKVDANADGVWQGGPDEGLRYGGDTFTNDGDLIATDSKAVDIDGLSLAGQAKSGQAYYFELGGFGRSGNPALAPIHANSFDISYEWYFTPDSILSLAYFYKSIDSKIRNQKGGVTVEDDGTLYQVKKRVNGIGSEIAGVEFAVQHVFDYLPGFLAHTGVDFNYTKALEASPLEVIIDAEGDEVTRVGMSDDSYNLQAFYSDRGLNVRLAYNWRGDYVRRQEVPLGYQTERALPESEKARGQLNFAIKYNVSKNLKIAFSASNLTDSKTERYLKHEEIVNYVREPGRSYTASMSYKF